MNGYTIFRLICLTALWLILCYVLIVGRGLTGWTVLTILISGGVVFIPLYKKYFRNGNGKF